MDDPGRPRRENGQQGQTNAPRSMSAVSDRFRQQVLLGPHESTSISSAASGGSSSRYSHYTQSSPLTAPSVQSGSFQYQPGYTPEQQQMQLQQRQFQQQQPQQQRPQALSSYGSHMMFNESSQPQTNLYHGLPPNYMQSQYHPQRYTGNIGGLPESLGDVPQSYVPREPPSASPAATVTASHESPSRYSSLSYVPQTSANRNDLSSSYSTGMSALPQPLPSAQDPLQEDDTDSRAEDVYASYQRGLRQTFQCVRDGRLAEAGQSLLHLSDWLLSNFSDLGLTKDDENRHQERIKLWTDFNTAWLTVLQKQQNVTQTILGAGQRLPPAQSLLSQSLLERMGSELVRLCDSLERHGLVDYQMGVWEEEIMGILEECLDLIEGDNGATFLELTGQRAQLSGGQ